MRHSLSFGKQAPAGVHASMCLLGRAAESRVLELMAGISEMRVRGKSDSRLCLLVGAGVFGAILTQFISAQLISVILLVESHQIKFVHFSLHLNRIFVKMLSADTF
ncbi:hypothetical protein QQF64_004759 [Cirrhinus molitorella]|uniref:Uncharacterized protein n=1 Tax=Cirrhinus molitorella TaxID=172907 RepID=A0ABR3MJZ2_9TELE